MTSESETGTVGDSSVGCSEEGEWEYESPINGEGYPTMRYTKADVHVEPYVRRDTMVKTTASTRKARRQENMDDDAITELTNEQNPDQLDAPSETIKLLKRMPEKAELIDGMEETDSNFPWKAEKFEQDIGFLLFLYWTTRGQGSDIKNLVMFMSNKLKEFVEGT